MFKIREAVAPIDQHPGSCPAHGWGIDQPESTSTLGLSIWLNDLAACQRMWLSGG
jgi:hypothetical protein